jgi:hypothetical protein
MKNINGNNMREKCKCDKKLINLTWKGTTGREEK